jgi:cob(I)alamin adenosyltransferase
VKLYTRCGDEGQTALFSGERVSKADARVEAYGALDEACSVLGWALAAACPDDIRALGIGLQNDLFDLGAELATPPSAEDRLADRLDSSVGPARVEELEAAIDAATGRTPDLKGFVLPGGVECAARMHIARTVVRRAERQVVAFAAEQPVRPEVLGYLNRLSDLLFALARDVNHRAGEGDLEWRARKP